jgi:hypothetical protein
MVWHPADKTDTLLPGYKAGQQQLKDAQNAIDFQRQVRDTVQADAQPLFDLRNTSMNRLTSLTGGDQSSFYGSPEFTQVRNAAASVGGDAPAFAQGAITDRANGIASNEYGNNYNRLVKLAGIGSSGANSSNSQLQASTNYLAQLAQGGGEDAASAILSGAAQKNQTVSSGITALLSAFSDATLKTDIEPLFKLGPLDWCRWTWRAAIEQPAEGFIAQQVQRVLPDAVHRDPATGYLKVNYSRVFAWLCR